MSSEKNFCFSYSIITYQHNEAFGIDIYSIGCELSHYDANKICELINKKYNNVILVSTCAVVESAKQISLDLVRKLHLIYPDKQILISGCAVNYSKSEFEKYGKCFTNELKFDKKNYNIDCIGSDDFSHVNDFECGSFVKIQDGCSQHCSYCIIPYIKNKPHSIQYSEIYHDISQIVKEGTKEISLIGTEVALYNSDGMNLVQLIKRILDDFPQIEQLNFNAIDPTQKNVVLQLIELMHSEKRIRKNLVLSPQSCSNEVLKMMNRHNTFEQLKEIMYHAKKYNVDIIWHIIIGFPGETEELFQQTYNGIKELQPFDISLHPYSDRKGTVSYNMQNKVSSVVINERIDRCKKLLYEYHNSNMCAYKGQLDIVKILVNDNIDDIINLNNDDELKNAVLSNKKVFNIDFNTDNYHDLELNTKVLFSKNKADLNLVCKLDSKLIRYFIDNNMVNLEEFGFMYSSNIILQNVKNIYNLSNDELIYFLKMLNNRRYTAQYYNDLQELCLDAINEK